jgi:NAD(P)-dependent dehydrogenase (short-subunit alcohol dehydrogenase family)
MKRVLITGCSSGIGEAAALRFAEAGHMVCATVRRQIDLERLQESAPSGRLNALIMDLTVDESVRTGVENILAGGPIDVLINNAGVPCLGAVEELALDHLKQAFDVNVYGVLRLSQAVLPAMRARREGQIINISSSLGVAALPMYGGYCMTKFALEAMSESLWYEVAPWGIIVNILQPGLVFTAFAGKKENQRLSWISADSPYAEQFDNPSPPGLPERISQPEIMADALLHMVENPSGQFRRVCGEDAEGWINARRTMDDAAFYQEAVLNGYGSV